MTEKIELTDLTKELLIRTKGLKDSNEKSMIIGERDINNGIRIFEANIIAMNPSYLDENIIESISQHVYTYLQKKEEITQRVNNRVHEGIVLSFLVLDMYFKEIKRKSLKNN